MHSLVNVNCIIIHIILKLFFVIRWFLWAGALYSCMRRSACFSVQSDQSSLLAHRNYGLFNFIQHAVKALISLYGQVVLYEASLINCETNAMSRLFYCVQSLLFTSASANPRLSRLVLPIKSRYLDSWG